MQGMFQCSVDTGETPAIFGFVRGDGIARKGGRVGSASFKLWNIWNIRNIINKTATCKRVFWNFFWNIRNIIVEHYKNKGSITAYML